MPYDVEFTDEFEGWWDELTEAEQKSVAHHIRMLEDFGTDLTRPPGGHDPWIEVS